MWEPINYSLFFYTTDVCFVFVFQTDLNLYRRKKKKKKSRKETSPSFELERLT